MGKRRKVDKSSVTRFVEMVTEIEGHRGNIVEDVVGLIEAKGWEVLRAYYTDPELARFLTEDEKDYIRKVVKAGNGEPSMLN